MKRTHAIELPAEEILHQRELMREFALLENRPKTYFVVTYGCQMNAHDSEKLEGMLQKKTEELKVAKEEKQKAPTRYSRMAAQIKIDYLVNVTNRCKAMIRKKKSYHKAEEKK